MAIFVIAIVLLSAIFAPLLTPFDPAKLDILNAKLAPGETRIHPLGTDTLGRDMLSRLMYGARTEVVVSLVALGIGAGVGTLLGLVSGFLGGWVDTLIMRLADAALGFPTILVAMVIVTFLGAGSLNIVLAVTLTVWARFARMIRGEAASIRDTDFVNLARIAGISTPMIIRRHVVPNTVNTLMVVTSLQVGQVILLEASLSFLGLGLPPGAPAWGIMVAEGRDVILDVWWLALFPGLAITSLVLALNLFGDWLRDVQDPMLRQA